ncbi:unnamed protein product [Adineta ricciae]|uniref:WWE domain-containing protein n=1 Tax=Adineta ricciae TaxID=249248 RepID=A0A815L6D3_ADIRI|nr:unnamed protein product [Adineta ricciae]
MSLDEAAPGYGYIWEYRSNADPWDAEQVPKWTQFPSATSLAIENAKNQQSKEIFIENNYRIDLEKYVQQHTIDLHRQRPIRRRRLLLQHDLINNSSDSESIKSHRERMSYCLGAPQRCSTTRDMSYYGSSFVDDWLFLFSHGKLAITFDTIFPALFNGLITEGKNQETHILNDIEKSLRTAQQKTNGQPDEDRITELEVCCARLYTKESYVYCMTNNALRDDDRTKLVTLGPFCYLLFNYIARCLKQKPSIRHRLRQFLHSNKTDTIILYRGDRASENTIHEYRQAAGDKSQYFKWLPFISTSRKKEEADKFAQDVMYIIAIESQLSNEDRFAFMAPISEYINEDEYLLLPGLQFQVKKVEFNNTQGLYYVHIKIISSYISKLH